MGKNTRKNKKQWERFALLGLAMERDGEPRPPVNPAWVAREMEQEGEEVDADGALIVRVDDDLDVPDVPTSALARQTEANENDG